MLAKSIIKEDLREARWCYMPYSNFTIRMVPTKRSTRSFNTDLKSAYNKSYDAVVVTSTIQEDAETRHWNMLSNYYYKSTGCSFKVSNIFPELKLDVWRSVESIGQWCLNFCNFNSCQLIDVSLKVPWITCQFRGAENKTSVLSCFPFVTVQ